MNKELKFCLYIIICIAIGFVDFFFSLRGLFTLLFDIVLAVILILKKRKELVFCYKANINNSYSLLILVLLSITINLAIPKGSVENTRYIDLYFIMSIFLKSFTEEVIFRGYWLSYFLTTKNKWFSVIFISLGFTVLHYFSGADLIFAFLGSITLSFLYIKTKSILNTYMVHLLSNLFFIYGLPHIIACYSNTEAKIKVKTIIIVFLVIIYLFKLLFKKSDDKNN
ncbi:CPBP family intramembrane glutamic endopeptidase [Flavobacterium sp. UMI-01]|uniref:CPBP family intramembrane glutamic endopeptidase n=1 Tax=Flavobacterium sp. UMI-01 TaxID=1441053 RepID=UPI001C7D6CCF|nr:CPBP family intramembrane glutamic endopeptidase [Flavobacterium sp. UMI-01]GIZ07744.1 hypothetical protein FUMI01_04710 [Flavobacterium sp. UMI-01]